MTPKAPEQLQTEAAKRWDDAVARVERGRAIIERSRTPIGKSLGRILTIIGQVEASSAEIDYEASDGQVNLGTQLRQIQDQDYLSIEGGEV